MIIDVTDIHLDSIRFEVTRADGRKIDFSEYVSEFSFTDHIEAASVEVSMLLEGPARDVLRVGAEGTTARVTAPLPSVNTGRVARDELWRGFFEEVVDDRHEAGLERQITAYDPCKFLMTHEEDYVFRDKTLSEIVLRVCSDLEIPVGSVPSTGRRLGDLVSRGDAVWDLFQKAIQRHFNLTGEAWRVMSRRGRLSVVEQGSNTSWWVFEVGRSVESLRSTRSIADLENRVKLYAAAEEEFDASKLEATVENVTSQRIYGLRQRVEYVAEDNEDSVRAVARQRIDANSIPDHSVEVTGWAVPLLRAGDRVRVIDADMGIEGMFYVESLDCSWSADGAQSIALCRKEPVLPDLFLEELVVA